jgi:hypothetical protein
MKILIIYFIIFVNCDNFILCNILENNYLILYNKSNDTLPYQYYFRTPGNYY